MKKTFLLLAVTFFCLSFNGHSKADDDKALTYSRLVDLENKTVETYEGFKITVSWDGAKPSFNITQLQTNVKTKDVNARPVVVVKSGASLIEVAKTNAELVAVQSFAPAKVVAVNKGKDDEGDLIQFNFLDDKGKVHGSEWRDAHDGFPVENVIYKDSGKPLVLTFYYRLMVNSRFGKLFTSPVTMSTLDNAIKVIGKFDSDNVNATKDFSIKLVHHVLIKMGFGDSDNDRDDHH